MSCRALSGAGRASLDHCVHGLSDTACFMLRVDYTVGGPI